MKIPELMETTPEREIVTTRIIKTPGQIVFKAWTDPEHLKNWWGPAGFTNTFTEFDLRPGGKWSFIMHGPDRGNYPNECTFIKIEEPGLIQWDHHSNPKFHVDARFEKVSDNETKVIYKMKFKTIEECEKLRAFATAKNEENMNRLEDELSRMK